MFKFWESSHEIIKFCHVKGSCGTIMTQTRHIQIQCYTTQIYYIRQYGAVLF